MFTRPAQPPTSCPRPETLGELLCERLPPAEVEAVEGHIGACTECQRTLQQLVGSLPGELGGALDSRGGSAGAPPDLPGYALLGRIDAGGMGVVWRVRDIEFQRTLAVKVMRSNGCGNPAAIRRFLAEAQITAQLTHPSVVPVHTQGWLPDGRPYFTMKLVEGKTLAALLPTRPEPVRQAEMVRVFAQVCQAVAYAHNRGIIHRDLKPANIMVGEFGEVQVMDWGLAKNVSGTGAADDVRPEADDPVTEELGPTSSTAVDPRWDTRPGMVMGTLPYMPPEQARGEVAWLDARCDVFNLGAILCEILTGEPPYRSESREELLRQTAGGELADAHARLDARGADAELVRLAKACLAPNRDARPSNAGVVAAAVVAYQTDVERRLRQAEVERAEAQVRASEERKRRRLATGLAAIVMLCVVGLAVAVVLVNQARKRVATERDLAEAYGRRTSSVLDLMTSTLAGESLETQPDITAEQKVFLAEVLNYYREIAGEGADGEAGRKRAAGAAYRVGLINYRLGFRDAAIRATEQARDRYRSLAGDVPADPDYREDLAHCHTNLGLLLRESGKRTDALEEFRQALILRQQLVEEYRERPKYRHELANAHHHIGLLYDDHGDRPAALSAQRQALAIRERLDAEFPDEPSYQRNLASSHTTIGSLLHATSKHTEAEAAFQRAIAIQEKLRARFPDKLQDSRDLVVSYNNLGGLFRSLSQPTDAENAYRKSLDISQQLVTRFPTVSRYQRDLASGHNNLGAVLLEQSKRQEAEESLRQALAAREKLNADFPAPEHRRELANSHNNLGILLKQSDRPAAEKSYRAALEIRAALAAEFRDVPEYRRELGSAHNNLGVFLREQGKGKQADAEKAYREAITIRTQLTAEFPNSSNYEHDLANTYNNLGIVLREQKKPGDAEDAYRKALAIQEKLFARHPRVREYGQDAAMSHFNLGNLYYEQDDFAAAETAFQDSLALWDWLATEFPPPTDSRSKHAATLSNLAAVRCQRGKPEESLELFDKAITYLKPQTAADRRLLGNAHRGRAKALVVLKRFDAAVVDWDRAVDLSSGAEKTTDRADRARALALSGQVERAVSEADKLTTPQADMRLLYQLAGVYALAAERDQKNRERHIQNSLQLLRRTVDLGFKDIGQMKKDEDLKFLRGYEEFDKLLIELEEKVKKSPSEKEK